MSQFIRGGRPQHINGATKVATVEHWPITAGKTVRFWFKNVHASEAIILSFTEFTAAEAAAGAGITIAAAAVFNEPVEAFEFWTYSAGVSAFQSLAMCRP